MPFPNHVLMAGLPSHASILDGIQPNRDKWKTSPRPAVVDPVVDGGESVWEFPRPPLVEHVTERVRVVHDGQTLADTTEAMRIVETAGAPVYYIKPEHVLCDVLVPNMYITVCEWKGAAKHVDLVQPETGTRAGEGHDQWDSRRQVVVKDVGFMYPDPLDDLGKGYPRIAGWLAFYASKVDACYVGDDQVRAQPGGYYAGWVTPGLAGPIKGVPGSAGW